MTIDAVADAPFTQARIDSRPPPAAETAERILDVGERGWFRGDDLDARLDEFANTVVDADQQYREDVLREILERDPNAFNSWLNVTRIDELADSGRISPTEHAALAETIAGAFNNGAIPSFEYPASMHQPSERLDVSYLDGKVLAFGIDDYSGSDATQELAESFDLVELINASDGPEATEFRRTYSEHLYDTYVLNDAADSRLRQAAAGIAAELMTGDYTRPNITVDVLSGYTPEQRSQIIEEIAASEGYFSTEHADWRIANNPRLEGEGVSFEDGLAEIFEATARVDSDQARALAVEFARLPDAESSWFGDRSPNAPERVEQFGRLFTNHSEAILDDLTAYDRGNAQSINGGDTDLQQYEVNADALSDVLQITVFNNDSRYQNAAQQEVLNYNAELTAQLNASSDNPNSAGARDATERIAMLSAASSHAVTEAFDQVAADRAAKEELIGFIVDLALVAIPVGDLVDDQIKGIVSELLPEGALRDAVNGINGKLINEATGRLTEGAKQELYRSLSAEDVELIDLQKAQDWLEETLIAGIDDENHQVGVVTLADSLADDLGD